MISNDGKSTSITTNKILFSTKKTRWFINKVRENVVDYTLMVKYQMKIRLREFLNDERRLLETRLKTRDHPE